MDEKGMETYSVMADDGWMDSDKVITDNLGKEESRYLILFLDDIFTFAKTEP